MDSLHIIFVSPSREWFEWFERSITTTAAYGNRIDFLWAKSLAEAQQLTLNHQASTSVIAVHKSAYEKIPTSQLPQAYYALTQVSDGCTEIVFIDDAQGLSQLSRHIQRKEDKGRLIDENSGQFEQQILSKLNEALAKKSSDGKGSLNMQIYRLQNTIDAFQSAIDDLSDRVYKIEHLLFVRTGITATPPLVETISDFQRLLNSLTGEVSGLQNEVNRQRKENEVMNRHVNDLIQARKNSNLNRQKINDRNGRWLENTIIPIISSGILAILTAIVMSML